jgi:hypothetical protein
MRHCRCCGRRLAQGVEEAPKSGRHRPAPSRLVPASRLRLDSLINQRQGSKSTPLPPLEPLWGDVAPAACHIVWPDRNRSHRLVGGSGGGVGGRSQGRRRRRRQLKLGREEEETTTEARAGGGGGDGGGVTALHCWWRGDGEGRRKKRKILLRLGWAGPAITLLFCPNFLWAKYKRMHQIVLRAGAKVRGTTWNNVGSRDGVN